MRKTNWYFEGWKKERRTDPAGKTKTVWNYQGVCYRYELDDQRYALLKAGYLIAALTMIALWFVFSFAVGTGREKAAYVGAPWYLQILPFMYLLMGLYGILRAGPKMTYRDLRSGYYRIRITKWILLILQAIALAGDIIYLIVFHEQISVSKEVLWSIGVCLCLACNLILFYLQSRYPPFQIPEE